LAAPHTEEQTEDQEEDKGDTSQRPPPRKRLADPQVDAIARDWWDATDPKPPGKKAWWVARSAIAACLETGFTDPEIRMALPACPTVSNASLEFELRKRRNGTRPTNGPLLPENCDEVDLS
jgi:hypothetical protein